MANAATLSAAILASPSLSDDRFFEATALLSTRFDRRSEFGDLRSDREAPQVLFDWFAHANSRIPDLRVWRTLCQVDDFFDPITGLYLPSEWQWDTRDRLLGLSEALRMNSQWVPVFERALVSPAPLSIEALACCGADLIGVDPYPCLMTYLTEHVDSGVSWHLINPYITASRLAAYLALARRTLLRSQIVSSVRVSSVRGQPPRERHLWHVWHEVLELLREFPGDGIDLIEAALRSDDLGVQLDAIEVLSFYWPDDLVPPDTVNLVRELAIEEQHPVVRARLERLSQGV